MPLTSSQKKPLKRIAHHLEPVILVGDQGISDGVIEETRRALSDHELIKVKFATDSREDRVAMADKLVSVCEAELIQRIGKTVVLYRVNPQPNIRLSNLHRYSGGA